MNTNTKTFLAACVAYILVVVGSAFLLGGCEIKQGKVRFTDEFQREAIKGSSQGGETIVIYDNLGNRVGYVHFNGDYTEAVIYDTQYNRQGEATTP